MKRFFTANIIRTAIFVALLSILPAMVIIAVSTYARYQDEITAADARGDRFVRLIALRQEQMTEVLETLVQTLGRLREVRRVDAGATSVLFRNLVASSAEYANIILLDNSGEVLATALPDHGRYNFSEYPFFEKALQRRSFSVSRVIVSPFNKEQTLYFAAPVVLEGRDKPGIVAVALNLAHFDDAFEGLLLPEGAAVYLADGMGKIVDVYPKSGVGPVGAGLEGWLWSALENTSEDSGRVRLVNKGELPEAVNVTFRKLALPGADSPYFHILYTQPVRAAYAYAHQVLKRDIIVFTGVVFLSLAAAVGLCFFTVRRPWHALLAAASRVGHGEAGVHVSEKGVSGEIGMLCREFNTMAEVLDKRDNELFAARDQAEQSRIAKGEFLANMSHEIRTSMNAILGMAYLVMKTELTAQQRGYISKLLSAANSLLRVINDILDFSKMEAGKMAMENISFSLRRILGSVRSESAPRFAEKKLGFDLQIDHDIPDHLVGDPLRLSQALTVLVDDAVTRSERGVIFLGCSVDEVDEQDADQITLRFVVRDAGVGLTPAQLVEMGELFALDEAEEPTTLDKLRLRLAIANRLFRMMHGDVSVSSVFGEGTVFTARARFSYVAGELRQPEKVFEGKRALVIDASEISRQDLADVLALFGFAVICADDVDAALDLLSEGQETDDPFAVVFLDWRPSATDMGARFARLRELPLSPPPPLVLTTAVGRAALPVSLEELEIDALLPKPINESLVFDTLMDVLDIQSRKTFFSVEETTEDTRDLAGLKILLAEDNAVNQQIAGEILESEGIKLTIVNNGDEATRLVLENPFGTFDLVLMDLQMPVMDGFAATRAIREHAAFHMLRFPVIAMTAHSDAAEITACFTAGMNDHTGKPIIIDKFLATIRKWLPVEADTASVLGEILPSLRELQSQPWVAVEQEAGMLLAKLVPVLHEGRVNALRAALADGNAATVAGMFEALDSMARNDSATGVPT